MDDHTMTCRDGTPYKDPEEQYQTTSIRGFFLRKTRPVLSRPSQMSAHAFELCDEPGIWEIRFEITPADMSLEIWFGRTFNPLEVDKSYKPGSKDKPDPDPDPLAFKCVAKFPKCTSIHKNVNGDYLLHGEFIVNYVEDGKKHTRPMPLLVNLDNSTYYPWNNLKYQFSEEALTLNGRMEFFRITKQIHFMCAMKLESSRIIRCYVHCSRFVWNSCIGKRLCYVQTVRFA